MEKCDGQGSQMQDVDHRMIGGPCCSAPKRVSWSEGPMWCMILEAEQRLSVELHLCKYAFSITGVT